MKVTEKAAGLPLPSFFQPPAFLHSPRGLRNCTFVSNRELLVTAALSSPVLAPKVHWQQ